MPAFIGSRFSASLSRIGACLLESWLDDWRANAARILRNGIAPVWFSFSLTLFSAEELIEGTVPSMERKFAVARCFLVVRGDEEESGNDVSILIFNGF